MCTHRPSQKEELRAFLTASHCLTYHLFTFFGQVLCSTVGVVRKTQITAGPAACRGYVAAEATKGITDLLWPQRRTAGTGGGEEVAKT